MAPALLGWRSEGGRGRRGGVADSLRNDLLFCEAFCDLLCLSSCELSRLPPCPIEDFQCRPERGVRHASFVAKKLYCSAQACPHCRRLLLSAHSGRESDFSWTLLLSCAKQARAGGGCLRTSCGLEPCPSRQQQAQQRATTAELTARCTATHSSRAMRLRRGLDSTMAVLRRHPVASLRRIRNPVTTRSLATTDTMAMLHSRPSAVTRCHHLPLSAKEQRAVIGFRAG